QEHRTVRVNLQQGAGLVEQRGGECNAEFHGRQSETPLDESFRGVAATDFSTPAVIFAAALESIENLRQPVGCHLLAVVRDVALADAVQVGTSDSERIQIQRAGD